MYMHLLNSKRRVQSCLIVTVFPVSNRPSVFPGTERNGTERSGPETPPYYTERTRGQSTVRTTASLSILSSGRQTETMKVDVD